MRVWTLYTLNTQTLTMTIQDKAKSWAISTGALRVYPQTVLQTYGCQVRGNDGKYRRGSKHYVELVIETGNSRHVGKHHYEQGQQMTDKINEIYIHYYKQANPYEDN